ncbi:transposase [Paraburkholderia sp. J12]|uniref:transposase n=1 Tax=Paraburkholderia sp. J12 TaxID=2805432 RepID=UPI002ABE16F2|nr:transposase [Paraburkholderia sp. J12]
MNHPISFRPSPALSDEQWRSVESLFREGRLGAPRRGRPAHKPRAVFGGIHWVLWTGAVWSALPDQYPDFRTCHRRFKGWFEAGLVQQAMSILYGDEGIALCAAMSERMQAWRAPAGRKPRFPVASTLRWPVVRPIVVR